MLEVSLKAEAVADLERYGPSHRCYEPQPLATPHCSRHAGFSDPDRTETLLRRGSDTTTDLPRERQVFTMSAIHPMIDEREREKVGGAQAKHGLMASLHSASSPMAHDISGTRHTQNQALTRSAMTHDASTSKPQTFGNRTPAKHGFVADALVREAAAGFPAETHTVDFGGARTPPEARPGRHAWQATGDIVLPQAIPMWLVVSVVTHVGLFAVLPGTSQNRTQAAAISATPQEVEVEWVSEPEAQEEMLARSGSAEAASEEGAEAGAVAAVPKPSVRAPTPDRVTQRIEANDSTVAAAVSDIKPESVTPERSASEPPSEHAKAAIEAAPDGVFPAATTNTAGVASATGPSGAVAANAANARVGSGAASASGQEGPVQARRGLEGGADLRGLAAGYLASLGKFIARSQHYPSAARRAEMEGTVLLDLAIDGSGRILGTRVRRSSGYPLLDEAATTSVAALGQLPAPPGALGWTKRALTLPIVYQLR